MLGNTFHWPGLLAYTPGVGLGARGGVALAGLANLTEGLSRLRENAVQLARQDARDVIARFGQMGGRRLAAVG